VKLLLDTHVALWAIAADTRLPRSAQLLVADPSNDIFLSAASIWEITIKYALNRGRPNDMPVSGPQALAYFKAAGYGFLSVTAEHAAAVSNLPDLHRDPFDRIIVAQALYEPLRLITHDAQVGAYSDSIELV
jgi:PIN domain nuclease of toxin-antitoxin system